MRVTVDYDVCESNAICMAIAPTVFEVGDDDNLRLLDETPDESLRGVVAEAVQSCPRAALHLAD
jgi:ferredoxin